MSVDLHQDDDVARKVCDLEDRVASAAHGLRHASANGDFMHDVSTSSCALGRIPASPPSLPTSPALHAELVEAIRGAWRHIDVIDDLAMSEMRYLEEGFEALIALADFLAEPPAKRAERRPDAIEDMRARIGVFQYFTFARSLLDEIEERRRAHTPDLARDAGAHARIAENLLKVQSLSVAIEVRAKERRAATIADLSRPQQRVTA